ncbi:MAG: hypothetical protein P8171_26040 [Candidatus Thiodiazotropha sp.]
MSKETEIDENINVIEVAENIAELYDLEGRDHPLFFVGSSRIGKTELHQIAVNLTKARRHREFVDLSSN